MVGDRGRVMACMSKEVEEVGPQRAQLGETLLPINGKMDNLLLTEVLAYTPMQEQILTQRSGGGCLRVPQWGVMSHRLLGVASVVGVLECEMSKTENEEKGNFLIGKKHEGETQTVIEWTR